MIEDDVIVSIPGLLSGAPCFRGTRITQAVVDAELAGGVSLDAIISRFPTLDRADLQAYVATQSRSTEPWQATIKDPEIAAHVAAIGRECIAMAHAAGVSALYIDPEIHLTLVVEEMPDGTRWLLDDDKRLPVISRQSAASS